MRRTNIGVAAAAVATIAAVAAAPVQATASRTSITDPSGDANGLDGRFYGAPTPSDTQNTTTSNAALDVTSASVIHGKTTDEVVVRILAADPSLSQQVTVTLATPACAKVQLSWVSGGDGTMLAGCHGTQRDYSGTAKYVGNDLVFTLPSPLPRWLPAGTVVTRIDVETQGYDQLLMVGALTPPADYASGSVDTAL
ncbi:MAG: hypothetical protein JO079_01755 [Frankiaceae bacterium]|nr:hypothetical protein [Frankiaceae bacterium]MBV9368445.1 hypothetical protein [Frankiales bacterium]